MQPIILFVISCFFFACMTACGKFLSADMHPTTVILLRNAMSFIICLPILLFNLPEIKKERSSKTLWTRALLSQVATSCWFMGISKVSLPSAMAVSFSSPLFTTIAAVLLLNEKISYRRGTALIIGFIGVLIILQPSTDVKSLAPYSWIVATVICWALVNIVIKKLSMSVTPAVILFYMTGLMTIFAIPLGLMNWQPVSINQLPFILLISVSYLLWQLLLIKSFAQSSLSKLQPFEFSKLIFASLIGYLVFNETMPKSGWIGVVLIIVSSCYVSWREAKLKKNNDKVIVAQD
jgi:drug/metabolite transporter (DMT)-like permease